MAPVTDTVAPLFQPLRIGSLTLRNRVIMSALTRARAVPTNVPNSIMLEYYQQRSKGAGLIVTEGTLISPQGCEWPNAPGIWSKEQVEGWKRIVGAVHMQGGLIFCQLWHVGRLAHPDAPLQKAAGTPVWAPSAIAARGQGKFRFLPGAPGFVTPTELPNPMQIVETFRLAAQNAKDACFDGVEIHGASGYLIHEFLDSSSNHRTDEWGGSPQRRCKFAVEVLKAVVGVFGPQRVGFKITPCGGYNDMGMPLQETLDTYQYLLRTIDTLGLAYVTVVQFNREMDPKYDGVPRGTDFDVLKHLRPSVKATPFFLNCNVTPERAAELISAGTIDAGVFGRLWITHPDLARRIKFGKPYNVPIDFTAIYGPGEGAKYEDYRKGYCDYPKADYGPPAYRRV